MSIPASDDGGRPPISPAAKSIMIGVLVALALGAILYFVGMSQGRSQLAAQKAAHEQRISAIQAELRGAQSELTTANTRRHVMEARAALYRTLVDLDQRNFGTANEHLQEAALALGRISKGSNGVPVQQIDSLRVVIAGTDINVATNLQQQRAQVLDLAAQLDALDARLEPAAPAGAAAQ